MIHDSEARIPLAELPQWLRTPRPLHKATAWRWALKGVGKPRVKLESEKVGGQRFTTASAIARFLAALNQREAGGTTAAPRFAAHQQSEKELDSAGIL